MCHFIRWSPPAAPAASPPGSPSVNLTCGLGGDLRASAAASAPGNQSTTTP